VSTLLRLARFTTAFISEAKKLSTKIGGIYDGRSATRSNPGA
jgi:hypothetical protein